MPTRWYANEIREAGGRFQIVARRPGFPAKDITYLRGVPTIIGEYSTADPFGWAGGRLEFPQLTGFDSFGSGELYWLVDDTDIDIWRIPAQADVSAEVINPLTQSKTDDFFHNGAVKVFEGFFAGINQRGGENEDGWGVDLLGALYQADGYLAKPMFPPRPITHEELLRRGFNRTLRPHLRTAAAGLRIEWPVGWTKTFTEDQALNPTIYNPIGVKVGENYSGYGTRNTGAWDAWLTSFAQDLISVMWIDDKSGVTPGNQWTILCDEGRQPVLRVRDRFRAPDFEVWFGTPGVELTGMSRDVSQARHALYGEGTNLDGTNWRTITFNTDPATGAEMADYIPLVSEPSVYPISSENTALDTSKIVREKMVKYSPGISKQMAESVAGQQYAWDRDPGWTGTMRLKVDPGIDRWTIRAGMVVRIKGFAGSGEAGIVFHIGETTANPEDGTVTCKIDTKFRDLLAFEEAVARTRDPLTPSKILQINKSSIMIEDQMAPWDYGAGSGFMPLGSKGFYSDLPKGATFPYWKHHNYTKQPRAYPDFYVMVNADSPYRRDRWSGFQIIMSEKGAASHIQMQAYDKYGEILKVEFHLSLYYINVTHNDMPYDGLGPSPFIDGAFQTVTPTGAPIPDNRSFLLPDKSFIIGWGDSDQPAGYSPGAKSDGDPVTGCLVDSASFTWDMTQNKEFDPNVPGSKQPTSAFSIYGMLYCEYTEDVYFQGRIFRQEPGTS